MACGFRRLRLIGRVMSADTDSHTRPAVSPDPRTLDIWMEYIQDSMDGDGLGWLAYLRFTERHSWELLVLPADLCWGLAIPARLYHCCCYPDTTTDLNCWCSLDMFESGWSCHCWPVNWTADFLTVHSGVAPKNHFLNRSTSPISLLFHYLWWVVG